MLGTSGSLAATNAGVAVLVAILAPGTGAQLGRSDVLAVLQGGSNATVSDVQPVPRQPSTFIIEVSNGYS